MSRALLSAVSLAVLIGCGRFYFETIDGSQADGSVVADSRMDVMRLIDGRIGGDAAAIPGDAATTRDAALLADANPACPGVVLALNNHCYYSNIWLSEWNPFLGSICNLGGTFAAINSEPESDSVTSVLSRSEMVWIGLNDRQTEGVFEWSNGEPVTYLRWRNGEPDNGTAQVDENCVAMDTVTGEWETRPCTDQLRVLCEFAL